MASNHDLIDQSDSEDNVQHIMALSWDKGMLGAVYYNLTTLELYVMHETVDLRPDYPLLGNLLRQVCPSYLLLCGPLKFVQDMLKFLKIDPNSDLGSYKVSASNYKTSSNIVIFPHDQKSTPARRNRVLKISLPSLPDNATDSERAFFLESVLPLNQPLIVQSLGNLLVYMDHNWRHIYLVGDDNPIVTNLHVYHMESQVLIDESTFYALQIFTTRHFHPSAMKQGSSHENTSVFELFVGKCVSTIGVHELQTMLQQPTRDVLELNLRHATIEWCAAQEHQSFVVQARKLLKNVLNATNIFGRIVKQCGEKASDFKSLKKTVYNAYLLCQLCSQLDSIRNTFMYDLGNVVDESDTLKLLLYAIERIVDLEESEKENRFVVKAGLDRRLDAKKRQLFGIQNSLYDADEFGGEHIRRYEFAVAFIQELGFLVSAQIWHGQPDPKSLETDLIRMVMQTEDAVFYRTPFCEQLNVRFGDLYAEICQHERKICRRLIKYINEAMPELIEITKLCAKLDCMVAFALVATEKHFVRPILTNEKCLYIKQGRHCLVEMRNNFVPNDTTIDLLEHKNLVNILSAPNAAGKSVYLKQVALICYLAHIGSFVPATEVRLGVLDAIYSRIYCPESVHKDTGSSFMADLQQMSRVIMNSTTSSLVLIDEFGKGTNLVEGRCLFAACLENIIERGDEAPITIVSTHFPEIYNLLRVHTNVCLKTIKTERSDDGALQSLYQIVDGCNRGSYASEYKEAKRIIDEILSKNPSLRQRSIYMVHQSHAVAMKTFVLALLKIYLRDKRVDFQAAYTMYSKAIADIFIVR